MTIPLDIFDSVIKTNLERYIQKVGYKPEQLASIINQAIDQAKNSSSASSITNPAIVRGRIESTAKVYVDAVLSQNKKWNDCKERIKAYSAVFLVGAGISYGSDMPLSNILEDLLRFCRAKTWEELRQDKAKCLLFKTKFKEKCDEKTPSQSHTIIFHNFPNYIWEIICLNWDDLFEKAAKKLGIQINKCNTDIAVPNTRYLWKFHGDVELIKSDNLVGDGGWVFPDENGFVFESFLDYINRTGLAQNLFTFVIIGYSEKEEAIYKKVTSLLELDPPRPTYRICPDLKDLHKDFYIVGTTEFTLNKILPVTK